MTNQSSEKFIYLYSPKNS